MKELRFALLLGLLLGGTLPACALSAAQQDATRQAWAERDAVQARECDRKRGMWIAGGCNFEK